MLLYWPQVILQKGVAWAENDSDGEESAWPASGDNHRRG